MRVLLGKAREKSALVYKKFRNIRIDTVLDSVSNLDPLSANPTKWSNTLKQFVGNLPTNCLSVLDHFVKLALKGLSKTEENLY